MVHPRPGYRSGSVPGPTTVDRRRWFGRDRCNGRGIRPDRATPCFLHVRHVEHDTARFGSPLFTDTDIAVHEVSLNLPRKGTRRRYFGLERYNGREFIIPLVALACYVYGSAYSTCQLHLRDRISTLRVGLPGRCRRLWCTWT